ncbi:MAG: Txe/YoeB family addiction module toxin [Bacteroidota bacterium]
MKKVSFTPTAMEQFAYWSETDKKVKDRIVELLEVIVDNPFDGIGKPEPLKHLLKGCWSRRINKQHRLVYRVLDENIIVISCRFHY